MELKVSFLLPIQVAAGTIKVSDANNNLRARLIDVVAVANKKSDTALVDIRSNDEYTGKVIAPAGIQELAVRAGHIPGAVNVPWGQAVAEDGTFKSAEELKKVYGAVGIDGKKSSSEIFAEIVAKNIRVLNKKNYSNEKKEIDFDFFIGNEDELI